MHCRSWAKWQSGPWIGHYQAYPRASDQNRSFFDGQRPCPRCASVSGSTTIIPLNRSSFRMGFDRSITPDDKRTIQSLLLALEPLDGLVPLRWVTAFLTVANNEGKGVCEYARCLGIHRATTSRFIHELTDRSRHGGPGLGLIRIDEGSGRPNRQEIFLSKKGHAVARAMLRRLPSPQKEQTPVA